MLTQKAIGTSTRCVPAEQTPAGLTTAKKCRRQRAAARLCERRQSLEEPGHGIVTEPTEVGDVNMWPSKIRPRD
jgi:hypothetical protein